MVAVVLLLFCGGASRASESSAVDLVLGKLPANDSREYASLRETAGAAVRESLSMTGAEMWSVPRERLEAFLAAAGSLGVEVMKLDPADRMAKPMAAPKMTAKQAEMMHKSMDSRAAMGMTMMDLPKPSVMEHLLTKGMNETGDGARARLVIPLSMNESVTAHRTGINKTADGYIWRGVIDGSGEPVTLLWWPDGRISGTVTHGGHMYVIKSLGGGMQGMLELDPNKMPPDHAPASNNMMRKMDMKEDPLVHQGDASMMVRPSAHEPYPANRSQKMQAPAGAANPAVITLIVAYTKKAAAHYDDIVKDLIAVAVAEANQSFRDSGIDNVTVKLVHAYETDYVENGSHFDHVYRFRNKGDGYMDEVHDLRAKYGADVAALVVDDPKGCGLSIRVGADAADAFTALDQQCMAAMYSLSHEIGHLIGARHDRALDDTDRPFAYGHGFVNGNKWRTIMSYGESCGNCPRRPVWSSPEVKIEGVPAGDANTDNARVIREGAARVGNFLPGPTSASAR
jgi:hypothetical protein